MDFINHREGGMFSTILLYRVRAVETVRGCMSLKKQKSQGKAVEVTSNSKEENSQDFCLNFVQEFVLRSKMWYGTIELRKQILKRLAALQQETDNDSCIENKGPLRTNKISGSDSCIPRNETAQPRHFQNRIIMFCLAIPRTYICERFIYSHDLSVEDLSWEYINHSQIHE